MNKNESLLLEKHEGSELVETVIPTTFQVIEEAATEGKPKKLKIKGHFANCNEATANRRFYKQELWEREIAKLRPRMESRNLFGELDHPSDGKTLLTRVSHVITDMRIEGNQVVGEAEILPTPTGQVLRSLVESGCKVGVSSRGYGSVKEDTNGNLVVQDDFSLATFDAVGDPAAGAFPRPVYEATEYSRKVYELPKDQLEQIPAELLQKLQEAVEAEKVTPLVETKEETPVPVVEPTPVEEKKKEPCGACGKSDYNDIRGKCCDKCAFDKAEKAEALEADLEAVKAQLKAEEAKKEEVAASLAEAITKAKAEIVESVRAEMLADPAVAGAKTALESVKAILTPYILPEDTATLIANLEEQHKAKVATLETTLAESTAKVSALEERVTSLSVAVKKYGFGLFLEHVIEGYSESATVRKLVGDVMAYESTAQIQDKVTNIKKFLDAKKEESKKAAESNLAEQKKAVEDSSKEITESVAKVSAQVRERDALLEEYATRMEEMVSTINNLRGELATQKKANSKASLLEYAESLIANHPARARIRKVLTTTELKSRDDVDVIVETFQEDIKPKTTVNEAKERLKARYGSGGISQSFDEISESTQTEHRTVEGVDISHIKKIITRATKT